MSTATLQQGAIRVRPATPDDISFTRQLFAAVRSAEFDHMPLTATQKSILMTMQFEARQADYSRRYSCLEHSIIEVDDINAGQLIVDRDTARITLVDIALLEQYRGNGIGTRIISDIIEEAFNNDRRLTLHVAAHNQAIRLYERLGFEVVTSSAVYNEMEWRSLNGKPAASH